MFKTRLSRRHVMFASLLPGTLLFGRSIKAAADDAGSAYRTPSDIQPREPDFGYAFQRTEEEWRTALTEHEYRVLREGGTERPKSSPLWTEEREGDYRCKGCELLLYSSNYKLVLPRGWVFFTHSEPDATMTGIDLVSNYGRREVPRTMMEVHCRNCGSHLGHMVHSDGKILHCINGASLTFHPV